MPEVRVVVASVEEAEDGIAEFWCGGQQVAETVIHDGRLHLRVDPRADREPWLLEVTSLAVGLAEAQQRLAAL